MLVRSYFARRTKEKNARPPIKAYILYQREVYEEVKEDHPELNTYQIKKLVGAQWQALPDAHKRPYQEEAGALNRESRQSRQFADPAQLRIQ